MDRSTEHWSRWLTTSRKPAYLSIADLIADDIKSGRLGARDRLPPLRTLADDLGLNYTTVARGYAEARRRGLIDGSPGRGTYIRPATPVTPLRSGAGGVEMTMNLPPEPHDDALRERLADGVHGLAAAMQADPYALLRYQEFGGSGADREAAVRWLAPLLPDLGPERVLVAPGIQSTLMVLMGQLVRPGELMCAEALTFPGVKAIAAQLGVRLHALPLDDEGPDVQAFELACKSLNPRALYLNPTLQNPTTLTISAARREALADVALRYSVPIIEDDAYAMLPDAEPAPAPLATLAPELTYHLTGFSKCLGAGLRVAYVTAPDARKAQRLAGALRGATVMASPLMTALATRWIDDGTALAMRAATRRASIERQRLAAAHLPEGSYDAHPEGFHLWLRLPRPWSGVEFASHLRSLGVGVVASPSFCLDGRPPEAVRVCLGGPTSVDECDRALGLIADTLAHPPSVHASVM